MRSCLTDGTSQECSFAGTLADQLRAARRELTARWLERVSERVAIHPNRVFPTDELLDHVPLLIDGIANHVENPSEDVTVNTMVVGKAMELGALRHAQGFDAYEILKEYEILGGILFNYLAEAADTLPVECSKSEVFEIGQRLFRAIAVIQQTTTSHFLRLADHSVGEREGRLRAFNRAVSHEIKNRIGAVLGASELLSEADHLSPAQRQKFLSVISRNARAMGTTVENLLALSRMEKDARQHRRVQLPEAVTEACRQLRDTAAAQHVEIRIAPNLPPVEVNAAAVELCLINYLGNAIKYADPANPHRFAEVSAEIESESDADADPTVIVRVRDNGIGVPDQKRQELFRRFFRAHQTVTGVEGTGLGLSIVRETAESLGGKAWAEFTPDGSIFAFSLPCRRAARDEESQIAVGALSNE